MVGEQLLPSHRVNFSVKHQGVGLPKTVSPTDDFQSGFPDTSLEEAIHETKPILQCRENDPFPDNQDLGFRAAWYRSHALLAPKQAHPKQARAAIPAVIRPGGSSRIEAVRISMPGATHKTKASIPPRTAAISRLFIFSLQKSNKGTDFRQSDLLYSEQIIHSVGIAI
jgi:hypothetical protein